MSRDQFTRWTCNSCAATTETPVGNQPKGWVGYGFTRPDVPAGEQSVLGHLCGRCAGRVTSSLEATA